MQITQQAYGKSNVRLTHVARDGDTHTVTQLNAQIMLEGDFNKAYTDGDNSQVLPTDTMKNTVYATAKKFGVPSIEAFAQKLANRFVTKFDHIHGANITIGAAKWSRIDLDGNAHGHAFVGGSGEEDLARVLATGGGIRVWSGLAGLQVLKTTESGFSGFLKDEYTSLQDTDDRIFATTITANWPCNDRDHDWSMTRRTIRDLILDVFAHNYSPSVQKTLHEMAEAILAAVPEIDEISLNMPNQHHLLANLAPINLENENEIFVPTAEPYGLISATLKR